VQPPHQRNYTRLQRLLNSCVWKRFTGAHTFELAAGCSAPPRARWGRASTRERRPGAAAAQRRSQTQAANGTLTTALDAKAIAFIKPQNTNPNQLRQVDRSRQALHGNHSFREWQSPTAAPCRQLSHAAAPPVASSARAPRRRLGCRAGTAC